MLENISSKVTIRAYGCEAESHQQGLFSEGVNTLIGEDANTFRAMFNPETFSVVKGFELDSSKADGLQGSDLQFKGIENREFSFDFLIDGTGASGMLKNVEKEVKKFYKITGFNGNTHQPQFLTVTWGTFNIRCRLKKVEIKYTLFRPDGSPARCLISATFIEHWTKERLTKENEVNSPDLTHIRTVKTSNTLPLLCYEIYANSKYYIEVARVNNLDNFRGLKQDKNIRFPPINKNQ